MTDKEALIDLAVEVSKVETDALGLYEQLDRRLTAFEQIVRELDERVTGLRRAINDLDGLVGGPMGLMPRVALLEKERRKR